MNAAERPRIIDGYVEWPGSNVVASSTVAPVAASGATPDSSSAARASGSARTAPRSLPPTAIETRSARIAIAAGI